MYVSEHTFSHLRQAADEQLNREVEYRRVARERAAGSTPATQRRSHEFVQLFQRSAQKRPAHS